VALQLKLIGVSSSPTDTVVASARTCYSSTPFLPEQVSDWKGKGELLRSLFEAGHHTTFTHPTFTLLITGISRLLIWRLLHSHPYYNSEQVSQRYTRLNSDSFYYPPTVERKKWERFYRECYQAYLQLVELLTPKIEKLLPPFKKRESIKKAQEFARYLLPVGATANLYHTTSLLTLLRYISAVKGLPEGREEGKRFALQLAQLLIKVDRALKPIVDRAFKGEVEFPKIDLFKFKKLHSITHTDRLKITDVHYYPFSAEINYTTPLKPFIIYPDWGVVGGFTTYAQLSLSADAQNQRHRRSLGVRERLEEGYQRRKKVGHPFYYTPPIIVEVGVGPYYHRIMGKIYQFIENELKEHPFREVAYALPNSHIVEIVEYTDFSAFVHKSQMRLCFNAQEEIFNLTYRQIRELQKKRVDISPFVPPCLLRKRMGIKPYCPEGVRYCGIKVWKLPFSQLPMLRPI